MIRRPPRSTLFPYTDALPISGDIDLEVLQGGSGRPILLVHGVNPVSSAAPFLDLLAEHRSEEHTSELQSPDHLVCRLLLEKKKKIITMCSQRRRLYQQRDATP